VFIERSLTADDFDNDFTSLSKMHKSM